MTNINAAKTTDARPAEAVLRPPTRANFGGSDVFRREAFGEQHPLSIPRHSGVLDICGMLGWLDESNQHVCSAAKEEVLSRFHDVDYIDALINSEAAGRVEPDMRDAPLKVDLESFVHACSPLAWSLPRECLRHPARQLQ